jgi:SAM-dependent methyltransferase
MGREFHLVRCDVCGSAYSQPLPDDESLAKLYGEHFDYRWYRDHYDAKLRDARMRLREYQPWLGGRVLDFGGGFGYFARAALEAGLVSSTYDPYAARSDPGGDWDCLVALHVLEHANDPDRAIAQMKSRLRTGGKLLIAVPNFDGAGYRKLGLDWVWAQPPLVHIFHFTAVGLERLLVQHGFGDIEVSYHDRWDANRVADIDRASEFRRVDSAWGLPLLNRAEPYRRWIARRNARLRFSALDSASALQVERSADLAELEVRATLLSSV